MKKILLASVFAGLMAFPALAQAAENTTCADFIAMNADAQMKALTAMSGDAMASSDTMMSDDNMATNDTASGNMSSDAMGPSVDAVAAACKGHPDMMLHDAMTAAGSH